MLKFKRSNILIIVSILIYLFISVVSIYSASIYLSKSLGNLVLRQVFWYCLGICILYLVSKIRRDILYKLGWYSYLINLVLLAFLLFMAREVNGSKSWFSFYGLVSFQPSEFMKISLILVTSSIISFFSVKKDSIINELKMLGSIFLILLIPSVLTFLQPDTGIVIIYLFIVIIMIFVSGLRKRWFIGAGIIVGVCILLFFLLYFKNSDLFIQLFGSSFFYRMDRIVGWNEGGGMQLNNSLIAIGSSGIIGHGFNHTPLYFPEAGTDFIFTVFASNFGLVGSFFLICFILYFDILIINIGINSSSIKDKCTIAGICGVLIYQQVQNIGMTIGLLPITGITLPFLSYGGSSLISYMILIGIIININNNGKKKKPLLRK